jgi:hypothetical protein
MRVTAIKTHICETGLMADLIKNSTFGMTTAERNLREFVIKPEGLR